MLIRRNPLVLTDAFNPSELAIHCRADGDLVLEVWRLGRSAVAEIEAHGSLALLNQEITVRLDEWPGGTRLRLPIAPVNFGSEVTVTDCNGAVSSVFLHGGLRPALILTSDPPVYPRGAVEISYTAGFGATPESIPHDLRLAIMDQASMFFDARGFLDQRGGTTSQNTGLSPHTARIVARYRRVGL